MSDFEISIGDIAASTTQSRELNRLRNDKLMTDRIVKQQQNKWNNILHGAMAGDINDVLSGKTKVKLPFKTRAKYWLNNLFNKISKII